MIHTNTLMCINYTVEFSYISAVHFEMQDVKGKVSMEENDLMDAQGAFTTTTITMIVWAVIITLAIAGMGVMVYRRVRNNRQQQWSSRSSVVSDAESGTSIGGSISASSSIVDLSRTDGQGMDNAGFEQDYSSAQVGVPVNVHDGSIPDLNKQEDLDFENLGGLYEEDCDPHVEEATEEDPNNLASTRRAFGAKMPRGTTNQKPLQNLFIPDQGSSFM